MTSTQDTATRTLRATLALAEVPFGPEDADAIHAVGRVLLDSGDAFGAADVFRLLALVAPTASRSWTALAACHEARGDLERARALYGAALVAPDHDGFRPFAAVNKARLDLDVGDEHAAELALEVADGVDDVALRRQQQALRARLRRSS